MISTLIRNIIEGRDLRRDESHELFAAIISAELSEVQKAAALIALKMKGETTEEIAGAVLAMRSRMTPVTGPADAVDTCGTGGDGSGTINVSTIAAIVAAAAGVPIAKHGNRAVSSRCGSADVLEALGLPIGLNAAAAGEVLRQTGFTFLFAPQMHPAMREVAAVRRELAVRTIFNVIGPLINPASVRRQVIGVHSSELLTRIGAVLAELGEMQHALVVHSDDGLDEISISAPTTVVEIRGADTRQFTIKPEDFGMSRRTLPRVTRSSARENAEATLAILRGEQSVERDLVIVNAAAALHVSGRAGSLLQGARLAANAIDDGSASAKLDEVREASLRAEGRAA